MSMHLSHRIFPLIAGALSVAVTTTAWAELRLPAVFGDHMVLQRDKEIAVWGWADAGESVQLTLADASVTAEADDQGKWSARFPEMDAGGPYRLTVSSGDDERSFDDVMVGEVWLCSGQSNMDMRLVKIWDDEKIKQQLQRDGLRLFRVERAVADEPADDLEGRWAACEPAEARTFSAVAYFFGQALQQELGVTVGLIHSAYGGTPAEAWTAHDNLAGDAHLTSILEQWDRRMQGYEEEKAAYEQQSGDRGAAPSAPPERYAPSGLYNAMIHPLAPYTIRGATWYQGESNVWRAMQYRPLLAALIDNWRTQWDQPDLPFGVVQLPNYAPPPRVPAGEISWAELREAQLAVAQDHDHVGLAVTIDVGDPTDVHPLDKETVGQRLAKWALGTVYDRDMVYSGPIYTGHDIDGDRVILHFDHVGGGLASRDGGPLRGFVISGPDGKFRWAQAEIDGSDIIVTEAKVPDPRAVRYAWADDPYWANLVNAEGLPASPFRTDDWEGVTQSSLNASAAAPAATEDVAADAPQLIRDADELAQAMRQAQPGDELVLADGEWRDQELVFAGHGSAERPITLRPQTPGQLTLTGQSNLSISGSHLVVSGLRFENGQPGDLDHIVQFRGPEGEAQHCRLTDTVISNYNPDQPDTRYFWVSLYGQNNRVDHCRFEKQNHSGVTVCVWLEGQPTQHRIDHNHFRDRPPGDGNGFETIRIGTSHEYQTSAQVTVEHNLFENIDGEIETISNKSCDNIFRHNTFDHSAGTLTLRHGNGAVVEGNYFLGRGKKNSGGIRVIGEDHLIRHNYFQEIDDRADAAISLAAGQADSKASGYFQVKNSRIEHNSMVKVGGAGITFAWGKGQRDRELLPEGLTIRDNLIVTDGQPPLLGPIAEGWTWDHNLVQGGDLDFETPDGVVVGSIELTESADGLWHAAASTGRTGVGAALPGGEGAGSADGFVMQPPLSAADVGPGW